MNEADIADKYIEKQLEQAIKAARNSNGIMEKTRCRDCSRESHGYIRCPTCQQAFDQQCEEARYKAGL